MSTIKIAPSILAADITCLGNEVLKVEKAGAEYLHIDIMDGHFVPNLSFSSDTVRGLRKISNMVFDVHLMITDPEKYMESFVEAGADIITVHCEVVDDLKDIAEKIHRLGVKAGVSVKPGTSIDTIREYIPFFDMVLIMTVEPGFGGQSYIVEMNGKIAEARAIINEVSPETELEVDGGIGPNNISMPVKSGANVIVAGSSIFKAENAENVIDEMRSAAL